MGDNEPFSNHCDKASTCIANIKLISFLKVFCHNQWVPIDQTFFCLGGADGDVVWDEEEVYAIVEFDRADVQKHIVSNLRQGVDSVTAHVLSIDLNKIVQHTVKIVTEINNSIVIIIRINTFESP